MSCFFSIFFLFFYDYQSLWLVILVLWQFQPVLPEGENLNILDTAVDVEQGVTFVLTEHNNVWSVNKHLTGSLFPSDSKDQSNIARRRRQTNAKVR
jgi:hypothetical protein